MEYSVTTCICKYSTSVLEHAHSEQFDIHDMSSNMQILIKLIPENAKAGSLGNSVQYVQ